MSHMDRLRRDHNESLQAIKSLREKLEAATSAQTLLRQRLDERTKAKDTASSTVQGLQNEVREGAPLLCSLMRVIDRRFLPFLLSCSHALRSPLLPHLPCHKCRLFC